MPRKGKKIMPEQPPANQAQPQAQQAQQSGQPQAHQVEQHLISAGLPQQALDTARAHGLNVQQVLGLVGQLLPVILQFIQTARGGGQPVTPEGSPGASQIAQPSGQQTTEPTQP